MDAVSESGVQHFVYSSLANYKKLSGGELSVPHCDMKAALSDYTRSKNLPATFVQYIGRTVGVVGADDSCHKYAATMSKVLEREIVYSHIPRETYAAFGFPGAEELAKMFDVQRRFIPSRRLDLIESYALNASMQPFEQWLRKNKARMIALLDAKVLAEKSLLSCC
nr:NmrA family NAD(P)-binding protein [Flavihumibacter sp. ZG627]